MVIRMETKLHYFKMAKKINEMNHDLLLKKDEEAHLRGNLKSMSLISISKDKPELGFSTIKNEESVFRKLKELKEKNLGRSTPEKLLQSYIIKHALLSNHTLPFGKNIYFITSEIAVFNKDSKRIVNDILGFNENGQLCIIELKSDRHMTRLKQQVDNFANIVKDEEHIDFFYSLLELYGHKWDRKSIQKIVVWPKAKGTGKKFKDNTENDILEFEYDKDKLGDEYVLEIEEIN